jgi:hypothetical protein
VERGGDYLFQIKGNQRRLRAQARALDRLPHTPFLKTPKPDTGATGLERKSATIGDGTRSWAKTVRAVATRTCWPMSR